MNLKEVGPVVAVTAAIAGALGYQLTPDKPAKVVEKVVTETKTVETPAPPAPERTFLVAGGSAVHELSKEDSAKWRVFWEKANHGIATLTHLRCTFLSETVCKLQGTTEGKHSSTVLRVKADGAEELIGFVRDMFRGKLSGGISHTDCSFRTEHDVCEARGAVLKKASELLPGDAIVIQRGVNK